MRRATVLFALAAAYHAAMVASALFHRQGRITPIDRLHVIAVRPDTYGEDVYCNYQAGHNLLEGRDMYSIEGATIVVPRVVPYGYHPIIGMLFALVNLVLSADHAHRVWIVVADVLLIGSAILLARHLALPREATLGLLAMHLAFTPVYPELFIGQYNAILCIFLVLILTADARGRLALSGTLWAISIVLKPSLVVLGPLYVRLLRYWRLILTGAFVGSTGAAYYLTHPGSFEMSRRIFVMTMARSSAESQGFYAFAIDLALRAGVPLEPALTLGRVVAFGIAGVAVLVLFLDRKPDPTWWALVLVITYALSAQMFWEHSYVLLLPVLGWLAHGYRSRGAAIAWTFMALPTLWSVLRPFDLAYVRPYGAAKLGFRLDVLILGALLHATKAVPLFVLWLSYLRSRLPYLGLPRRGGGYDLRPSPAP
ncbi:MAG: glycosyltransferase family 87 protein [Acidobacteriota bacterium]